MRKYQSAFFAGNGFGPYVCYECGGEVVDEDLAIHHLDGNKGNNDPSNLAAMHHKCHSSHHSEDRKGWHHSERSKQEIASRLRGRTMSLIVRERISRSKKGKKRPAHAEKIREAWAQGKYDNRKPRRKNN